MVMPLCGTFHYAGVVPETSVDRESGLWQLEDRSGAIPPTRASSRPWWKFWTRDPTRDADMNPLRDNRLVGLQPTLRILGGRLVLEAGARHRAEVRSASLELNESLIESLHCGDVLTLVRTRTADIGVSLLRDGRLIVAAGAVTAVTLGDNVAVRGGPVVDFSAHGPEQPPRRETWVDVSVSGETRRLREGEETTLHDYRFSVVRCFQDGIPGTFECLAISLEGACPPEADLHSARLLARRSAGLILSDW